VKRDVLNPLKRASRNNQRFLSLCWQVFDISKKIESLIELLVEPLITQSGYEYVGTEINKNGVDTELIVYADKPGGLELEDCELISKLIDPVIDEHDPIEESYFLCVSSPGLDRPLKSERDFARSVGKKVDLKFYRPIDGKKELTGELTSFDENGFTIDTKQTFAYKDAAIIRLHVDF
jgi:ribosome maturation factor RimP